VISYFVFFWAIVSQTPEKLMASGSFRSMAKAQRGASPVRYIGYWISRRVVAPAFSGFADDRQQGWHDKISGTYVVYTWHARPDEKFLVEEIEQFGK
jgi:uncharacterized RDD family membrane protein YckC